MEKTGKKYVWKIFLFVIYRAEKFSIFRFREISACRVRWVKNTDDMGAAAKEDPWNSRGGGGGGGGGGHALEAKLPQHKAQPAANAAEPAPLPEDVRNQYHQLYGRWPEHPEERTDPSHSKRIQAARAEAEFQQRLAAEPNLFKKSAPDPKRGDLIYSFRDETFMVVRYTKPMGSYSGDVTGHRADGSRLSPRLKECRPATAEEIAAFSAGKK